MTSTAVYVSNPYPRTKSTAQYRRVTATPRAITALSRTFARRFSPRKFSRHRWSRARAWSAIVFAIMLVFLCFRGRPQRVRIAVRNYVGKLESDRGRRWASGTARVPDGESSGGPPAYKSRVTEQYDALSLSQTGSASGSSERPVEAKSARESGSDIEVSVGDYSESTVGEESESDPSTDDRDTSGDGETESNPANESTDRGASPSRDLNMEAVTKVTESLRRDINEELEVSGEEGIPVNKIERKKSVFQDSKRPSSKAEHQNSKHSHQKGFAAQLSRQNHLQDAVHIKTANPWQELSGETGPYLHSSNKDNLSPAVEMWSHQDVPASHGFKFPFCRLYGACRTKSGKILLSKSLKVQRKKLARCGILSDGNFVLGDEAEESKYEFVREVDDANVSDMDLVERHAPRRGAQHFLADSMKTLFFVDATHGAAAKNASILRKTCIDASGNHPGPCIEESSSSIHPVMFIRKESFVDDVWVPHYMKLLAKRATMGGKAPLRFLNQYGLYPSSSPKKLESAACFRSITTSAYMYGQIPGSALREENPFFSGNGISRVPLRPLDRKTSKSHSSESDKSTCLLRVKLSDHFIGDSDNHLHEMTRLLKEKTQMPESEGSISFMLVLPERETVLFETQVKRMQEADILVAPHMLPLADVIFMRPGAGVVEVHPFAYMSGMFQGLSHQLGLSHSKVSAEPDVRLFQACLQKYNSGPEADAIPQLIAKMDAAAEQYSATGKVPLQLDVASPDFKLLREVKQCSRRQRMRIDPEKLADVIWSQSKRICNQ